MDYSCTIYKTADFIGKKWTLLILLELCKGDKVCRYQELKKSLPGITAKVLSQRLKELEHEGLVKKRIDSSSYPIKCEYSLTKAGQDFVPVIKSMKKWALKWKYKNNECRGTRCERCGI
ncbi:MAG: helix-turn-helix domain-containing protein [archaeon]